jgi:hypothetical protein
MKAPAKPLTLAGRIRRLLAKTTDPDDRRWLQAFLRGDRTPPPARKEVPR